MLRPTPTFSVYHSALALLKERRSLLFCIAVARHCVYGLLSFFPSALIGGRADRAWNFNGATTLVDMSVLLSWPRGVHAFIADFELFSVSQDWQRDYRDAYVAYHSSREMNSDDKDCVGWFPYVRTGGEVLETPSR